MTICSNAWCTQHLIWAWCPLEQRPPFQNIQCTTFMKNDKFTNWRICFFQKLRSINFIQPLASCLHTNQRNKRLAYVTKLRSSHNVYLWSWKIVFVGSIRKWPSWWSPRIRSRWMAECSVSEAFRHEHVWSLCDDVTDRIWLWPKPWLLFEAERMNEFQSSCSPKAKM